MANIERKKWDKEKKIKALRLLIALTVIIAISVGAFFIFKACGLTNVDNLQSFIEGTGGWSIVVFLLLYVGFVTLFSFVPAASMTLILVGIAMFGANWKTFLICFAGVILASVCMDLIGRFGGSKLITKLIGKEDYENALSLVQEKGMVYVPVMYLLPVFPDDAICMVVGATKMNFWVHLLEIVLCRGIGCATIVFGINILPETLMGPLRAFDWGYIGAHLFDYIVMLTVIVFWVIVLLIIARKVDKWLSKFLKKRKEKKEEAQQEEKVEQPEEEKKKDQ